MSSTIDIRKDRLFKKRLTSLDTSTKITNTNKTNISSRGSQLLIQNYSKIVLPSINIHMKRNKRKTVLETDSLFSKFIGSYKPNYSEKISEPIINEAIPKIPNIRKTLMIKSQSLNNILIPMRKEIKFNSQRIFGTNKDKIRINFLKNRVNSSKNLLEKIKENILEDEKLNIDNNKGEEITNIKNDNDNEDSLMTDKELYIINNNNRPVKTQQQNTNNTSIFLIKNDITNENNKTENKNTKTLNLGTNSSHNSSLISNKYMTNYRRLRKFPNIFLDNEQKEENTNIKDIKDIKIIKDNKNIKDEQNLIIRFYEHKIKFQSKIFEEQIRLFNGCFKEYKLISLDTNFAEVFKSKSLQLKIKYNKKIEETCSILYYLPKYFLREWYPLMFHLETVKVPSQKKFVSDYITDEILTAKNNNYLLREVTKYFNRSAEFFINLSKKENEAGDLRMNQQKFLKTIKYIKTSRYNITYLINSFNNSKKKYLDDLIIIKKFLIRNNNININNNYNTTKEENSFSKKIFKNVILLEDEKSKNIDAIEKIEEQFIYKRDDEAQKKKQIEIALDINKRKTIYTHTGKVFIGKKKVFKSIFHNKYMNKVLNYCYEDVKDKIITEKVDDQEEDNIGIAPREFKPIKYDY